MIEAEILHIDGRTEEVWSLPRDEPSLFALFQKLFENHWDKLTWGPIIEGAAYELRCPGPPRSVTLLDGYLTIHWGAGGHFHLCIGTSAGSPPELVERRRPSRIELYRRWDADGHPISWGLRMFNGHNEPQIMIFLPSPFLTPDDQITDKPDWNRLALWEELLPGLTGNEPDGRDRLGKGYRALS